MMEYLKSDPLSDQEKLLATVFPGAGLSYEYLDWLYRSSPDGVDLASDYREGEELLGHYTVVRQNWSIDGEIKPFALSLNTAVHEKARGKGLFTSLAARCYEDAKESGIEAVVGVANANSTPGFLKKLGFQHVCALPVIAGCALPIKPTSTKSYHLSAEFLASQGFSAIASRVAAGIPTTGCTQHWSTEKLKWRLSSPRGRYALHHHEEGTLITTTGKLPMGMSAVILLKFFPHGPKKVDTKKLVRAATSWHRTPFFIYSGFNSHASVSAAVDLPRAVLPSPLNLIFKNLSGSVQDCEFIRSGTFEFLDFDAY
ncbi:GNAT family N-acetyltransferase [Herbaspirillum sp.]|jgi:GNAT superfamily N-acetyltransferase|uniref:GNAT family N-acetyltransferase n=1 Tax=Herbaspirillum TaxID=963 RepID=UPI00258C2476|nr:GNAT family N-acetyltransferase [Herbaspirillum sp.]MCP3658133.1 GNAT family N-acetyltransferase [Herbaspirillum sp.]MCP3950429.1 GNAT family N-acetyltransferase [Herbaspirillum sp.]MCP4033487.1 GNAT family N-acetyltransferase [Herbaspirillum sp.]MCP4554784.1 GNAT family N-acetyltransferase [Herbaspirillum sp.]